MRFKENWKSSLDDKRNFGSNIISFIFFLFRYDTALTVARQAEGVWRQQ